MSKQTKETVRPPSSVITEQPGPSLDELAVLAPSLRNSFATGVGGGGAGVAAPAAGVSEQFTGRSVDSLTSNPYGQLGVTAFTEGIYSEDGHINPAFSEAAIESTGRMMTDVLGEDTMEKLEQRYAKAVDKITDVEMSAGQIAMVGQSIHYLDGEGGEEQPALEDEEMEPVEMRQIPVLDEEELTNPVDDVPDMDEMPDMFSTEMYPPEADRIAADLHELDADQLGQIATATGHIPQMDVS
uniref:Uncharacterized protein n=1 Tax=Anopheles maculatus TaxID=74869 RepID=A0A182SI49_9DIPT